MKLEDTVIYHSIKKHMDEIEIYKYKKGQYISSGVESVDGVFFILEGIVRVECMTKYGKSFLVDIVPEDEFVGKISDLYDQSLFCDIIAENSVTLAKINASTFKILQNNPEFLNIFFFKTSKRMYNMYKKLIMKDLFRFEELFAHYILENSKDDIFKFKSIYSLCHLLSTSRKNLYNTINKFVEKKYIQKKENTFIIKDKDALISISKYVKEYTRKDEKKLKFEL